MKTSLELYLIGTGQVGQNFQLWQIPPMTNGKRELLSSKIVKRRDLVVLLMKSLGQDFLTRHDILTAKKIILTFRHKFKVHMILFM